MSIDAVVESVVEFENGGGYLKLGPRITSNGQKEGPGQPELYFRTAPYEVTALNGLEVWGSADTLMLGEREIAKRLTYTRLEFVDAETFKEAVKTYHDSHP